MTRLLILALGAALTASACGTSASDATDTSLTAENGAAPAAAAATKPAVAKAATPARPVYRDVTLPAGTTLPLSLTSSMDSGTSAVEDRVTAELTRPVSIDGREVLPAGASFQGIVTEVDDAGHVKGRATHRLPLHVSADAAMSSTTCRRPPFRIWPRQPRVRTRRKSGSARAPARSSVACSAGRTAPRRVRRSAAAAAPASCSPPGARKCASRQAPMSPVSSVLR